MDEPSEDRAEIDWVALTQWRPVWLRQDGALVVPRAHWLELRSRGWSFCECVN